VLWLGAFVGGPSQGQMGRELVEGSPPSVTHRYVSKPIRDPHKPPGALRAGRLLAFQVGWLLAAFLFPPMRLPPDVGLIRCWRPDRPAAMSCRPVGLAGSRSPWAAFPCWRP